MTLPVALPDFRRGVRERGARDEGILLTVADAAMVLTPSHLASVGGEVGAGDVVMHAHLGAAKAGEERLGLVGAGAVSAVRLLVIDAVSLERGVETIPALSLIGVNNAAGGDALNDGRHGLGLRTEGEGESLALGLTDHDDDAALAGLVLGKATVAPIRLHVLGTNVATEVGAIHLNVALKGRISRLGGDSLAELVSHHEGRAVLAVEVAGELEGRVALCAVGEDRDGEKVVSDRELARSEDGAAGDAVLVTAAGALEELTGGDERVLEAATAGAERGALGSLPADRLKGGPRLIVRHAGDLGEVEGAGRF